MEGGGCVFGTGSFLSLDGIGSKFSSGRCCCCGIDCCAFTNYLIYLLLILLSIAIIMWFVRKQRKKNAINKAESQEIINSTQQAMDSRNSLNDSDSF